MDITSQKTKLNTKEDKLMIIMDLKIDNIMLFKDFHINMSYPKKIVDSSIEDEFLTKRKNFRYKKVNILMGANATGKTSLGKVMMHTFNLISRGKTTAILDSVCHKDRSATIQMDFVDYYDRLNRINIEVIPAVKDDAEAELMICIRSVDIGVKDNYESCAKKMDLIPIVMTGDIETERAKVLPLGWMFGYSDDASNGRVSCQENDSYPLILDYTLRALDPSIKSVEKLSEVKNAYVVRMQNQDVIIQDGEVIKDNILSSGTKEGIRVAGMLSGICEGGYHFYYCDELFSYVHSDVEKAFLSVMISQLKGEQQLFFTTHNSDILDMQLPKHTFTFLKKDMYSKTPLKCVEASKYLKRNTDSLRHAVENDLFSIAPNVELIYEIENIKYVGEDSGE